MKNPFSNLGDMLRGGRLVSRCSLPYDPPLSSIASISNDPRSLAIQERAISFTGEDFDVFDITHNQQSSFCRVRGAMLHLPGKDRMTVSIDGTPVVQLDRKLVSMTPTYDIYRGKEKWGWIEKVAVSITDTFDVYLEGGGGFGPFKPPPAFRIEGDFLERNFVMKNAQNEVVAKVSKDGWIQFDAFNHYQVQVAPGMDAVLVVACACAIDEEFDEEHKKAKEAKQRE